MSSSRDGILWDASPTIHPLLLSRLNPSTSLPNCSNGTVKMSTGPRSCLQAVPRLSSASGPLSQCTAFIRQAPACIRYSTQTSSQITSKPPRHQLRAFHNSSPLLLAKPPKSRDRGPASKEDTQTDFARLNVLNNAMPPTTGIDACTNDGFALNSGLKVSGSGVMLAGGEAFRWRPWAAKGDGQGGRRKLINSKGQWEVDKVAWGLLDLLWPKPGRWLHRLVCQILVDRH